MPRKVAIKQEYTIGIRVKAGTRALIEKAANGRSLSEWVREAVYMRLARNGYRESDEPMLGEYPPEWLQEGDFPPEEFQKAPCCVKQSTDRGELEEIAEEIGMDKMELVETIREIMSGGTYMIRDGVVTEIRR